MIERRKYSDTEIQKILKNMVVLVDSREKSAGHILEWFDKNDIKYEVIALPSGDYSFALDPVPELGFEQRLWFYNDIVVERKNSLTELSGNFVQNRERFNDEWSRCRADRKYLMIEGADYKDVVLGNYDTQYSSKSFLASLHSFNAKYNIQVMFMPDKSLSAGYMLSVFRYYLRYLLK